MDAEETKPLLTNESVENKYSEELEPNSSKTSINRRGTDSGPYDKKTDFKGCLTCQKKVTVYTTNCVMKGCCNKDEPGDLSKELVPGDHIEVPAEGCKGLFINHHAIVESFVYHKDGTGIINVIHVPRKKNDSKNTNLIIERGILQVKLHEVSKVKHKKRLRDEGETLKKAKDYLQNPPQNASYHFLARNCENFASLCVNGDHYNDNSLTHSTSLQSVRCGVICFHLLCLVTMFFIYLVNVLVAIGFVGEDEGLKRTFSCFKYCYIGKNNGFLNTKCDWEALLCYSMTLLFLSCLITCYRGCKRPRTMCSQCIFSSWIVMFSKILCISVMEAKNFILERLWLHLYSTIGHVPFYFILIPVVLVESLIVYFVVSHYVGKLLVCLIGRCCSCKCCDICLKCDKDLCIDKDSHECSVGPYLV